MGPSERQQAAQRARRSQGAQTILGSETVDAEANGLLPALLGQTARVPWDDRRALDAHVSDLSVHLVREHLRGVGSSLADEADAERVFRRMRLTVRANAHELPRNVGLLMFSDRPDRWFRGARIEAAAFPAGPGGDHLVERYFRGGLIDQIRGCSTYLDGLSATLTTKREDRIEADSSVSYPAVAVRELLANAVYHRGYDVDTPEPTKVHVHSDRTEIVSYPGPVPGVEAEHLLPGANVPAAPARNRRIGEFLKEAGLAEGRLTGLAKVFAAMERNGSPPPRFEFDAGRTYFRATLPKHRAHLGL